jgi:hypothetical protein
LRPQQDCTAQLSPDAQLVLSVQWASPAHGVLPSTQEPVSSVVLAQTQVTPGPHGPKVAHVWPAQLLLVQARSAQIPVGH